MCGSALAAPQVEPPSVQPPPQREETLIPPGKQPAKQEAPAPKNKATNSPFSRVRTVKKTDSLATVDPYRQDQPEAVATLTPIGRENEPKHEPLVLAAEGRPITLNRANLEPGNNTITSKVQAELIFHDGNWYIVDKSGQHTTFVRARKALPLQKGDIILMGNRKFEFDA